MPAELNWGGMNSVAALIKKNTGCSAAFILYTPTKKLFYKKNPKILKKRMTLNGFFKDLKKKCF